MIFACFKDIERMEEYIKRTPLLWKFWNDISSKLVGIPKAYVSGSILAWEWGTMERLEVEVHIDNSIKWTYWPEFYTSDVNDSGTSMDGLISYLKTVCVDRLMEE